MGSELLMELIVAKDLIISNIHEQIAEIELQFKFFYPVLQSLSYSIMDIFLENKVEFSFESNFSNFDSNHLLFFNITVLDKFKVNVRSRLIRLLERYYLICAGDCGLFVNIPHTSGEKKSKTLVCSNCGDYIDFIYADNFIKIFLR